MRFTLRWDPWGHPSACTDSPSGCDIHCRVDVRVRLVSAGCAPEDRLALAVVRCAMPADATGLRRVRGVDLLDPPRGFLLKSTNQSGPSVGEDTAIESGLGASTVRQVPTWSFGVRLRPRSPRHLGNTQVFHSDDVESLREVCAALLDPVLAAIRRPGVKFREGSSYSPMPIRTAAAAPQPAFQADESFVLAVREARARQKLAGRQCGRDSNSAVHAYHLARSRRRDWLWHGGERKMPAARPITGDSVRLRVGNGAGQPESHPADLRHQCLCPLAAQPYDPRRLSTDDPKALVQPGFAPSRPPVGAGVVVSGCLVEVPQGLLLHGLGSRTEPGGRGSCFSQLASLLAIPGCRALVTRPHRPLLNCQIPYIAGLPALLQQRDLLRRSWIQPEPRHVRDPIRRDRQSPIREGGKSRYLPAQLGGTPPRPIR